MLKISGLRYLAGAPSTALMEKAVSSVIESVQARTFRRNRSIAAASLPAITSHCVTAKGSTKPLASGLCVVSIAPLPGRRRLHRREGELVGPRRSARSRADASVELHDHRGTGPAAACLKQRAGIFDGAALKW